MIKKYFYVGVGCLVIGFLLGLMLPHCGEKKQAAPLSNAAQGVAMHDAETKTPPKAYDKSQLQDRGAISKELARDETKEVTAAAVLKDDSGTQHVAASLDKNTGVTELVQQRPLAEWMNRNDLGLGYGIGDGGIEKAAMFEHTFIRIWDFYGSAELRVTDPEKDNIRWSGMLWLKYRW